MTSESGVEEGRVAAVDWGSEGWAEKGEKSHRRGEHDDKVEEVRPRVVQVAKEEKNEVCEEEGGSALLRQGAGGSDLHREQPVLKGMKKNEQEDKSRAGQAQPVLPLRCAGPPQRRQVRRASHLPQPPFSLVYSRLSTPKSSMEAIESFE